jgi:hypothetical protein
MSTFYKTHAITTFQQFTGAWLAVYAGPLTSGTVRGYTRRQAAARAKLAILRECRSRAAKSHEILVGELRRANMRTIAQSQANWLRVRDEDRLPPRFRVKRVDAAPKDVKQSVSEI